MNVIDSSPEFQGVFDEPLVSLAACVGFLGSEKGLETTKEEVANHRVRGLSVEGVISG